LNLSIPQLIIHGSNDLTVSLNEAISLHKWNVVSKLEIIDEADHVFGSRHIWTEKTLPKNLQQAAKLTITFLNGL
jgi:alpha/beta superfamily hydrolase